MKKRIFITGSTDGIGKLAAIKLAKEGHEIYLHGRNQEKLSAVVSEIKTLSGNDNISGYLSDFSNLDVVRKMANQIKQEIPQIDVLINNAGIFTSSIAQNEKGMDIRMVVNYLAPVVLSNALLPLLQKSDAARIINLSSAAQAPIDYEVLNGNKPGSERASYAQSKLALTMWSFHLAQSIPDITVIAVNPGSLLNTKMVQEAFGKYWSSADKGANILYDLAIAEVHKNNSGKYYDNDQGSFGRAHQDAYNDTKIKKLIETTQQILAASFA